MKKIIVVLITIFSTTGKAQTAFEGLVEMKLSVAGSPTASSMKMYFSALGSRAETEMRMPQMTEPFRIVSIYMKNNPDSVFMLNDTYRSYSVKASKKSKTETKPENEYTVKILGNEKILGYKCIHSMITSKTRTTELWTTKEIIDYAAYEKMQESNKSIQSGLFTKGLKDANAEGFPLKAIVQDDKGKMAVTMEAVKVEKKKIADDLFSVPMGYKKTANPALGSMMQELQHATEKAGKNETEEEINRKIKITESDIMNDDNVEAPPPPNK
jgi:hypothetical protein